MSSAASLVNSLESAFRQQKEVESLLALDFKITGTPQGELKQGSVVALNADPDKADHRPFELRHVEKFIRDKSDDVAIMRTAEALDKTMHFLVHNYLRVPYRPEIWNHSNVMFEVWSYISDRFRGVRTDWIKQTPTTLDKAGFRRKQWLEFTVAATAVAGAWCSRNDTDCYHYIASQSDFYKFTCLEMIQKCFTELLIYFRMERRLRNAEMMSVLMIMNGLNQTLKQESREQFCMLNVEEGTIEDVSNAVSIQVYGELQAFPEMATTRHVRNVVRIIQCVEQRCWVEFFRLCRVLPWTIVQKAVLLNSFSYVRFRAVVDFVAVEPAVSSQFVARCRGFIPIATLTEWLMFDIEADCVAFLGVMGLEEFIQQDPEQPLNASGAPNLRLQVSKQVVGANGAETVVAITTIQAIATTMTKAGQKQRLFFPPHRDFMGFAPFRGSDGMILGDPDVRSQSCRINVMQLLECYCPPYREEDEHVHLADCPEELFDGLREARAGFLRSSRNVRVRGIGLQDQEEVSDGDGDIDDDASLCTTSADLADDTYRVIDTMAGELLGATGDGGAPRATSRVDDAEAAVDDDGPVDHEFVQKLAEHREAIAALARRDVYTTIRQQKQRLEQEEEERKRKAQQEVAAAAAAAASKEQSAHVLEKSGNAAPSLFQQLPSQPLAQIPMPSPQFPPKPPTQLPFSTVIDFGNKGPIAAKPLVISPGEPERPTNINPKFPEGQNLLQQQQLPSALRPVVEPIQTAAPMSPSLRPVVESPTSAPAPAFSVAKEVPAASALALVPISASTRVRSSGALHPTFVSPPKQSAPPQEPVGPAVISKVNQPRRKADESLDEAEQPEVTKQPVVTKQQTEPSDALKRALALSTHLLERHQRASVFGVALGPVVKKQPLFPLPWSDIFVTYMTNFFRFTYGMKQVDEVIMYLATLGVAPMLPAAAQQRGRSSSRARRSCSMASIATSSDAAVIRSDVERRLPLGINVVALPSDDASGSGALSLLICLLLIGPNVNASRTERPHATSDYVFSEDVPSLTRKFVAMLRGAEFPMNSIGSGSLIREATSAQNIRVTPPAISSFLSTTSNKPIFAKSNALLRRLETSVQCHVVDYAQLDRIHFHAQLDDDNEENPDIMLPLAVVCAVVVDATTDSSLQQGVEALEALIEKHWNGTIRLGGVVIILDAIDGGHAEDVESDLRNVFWSRWMELSDDRSKELELLRTRQKARASRREDAPPSRGRESLNLSDDLPHSFDAPFPPSRPSFSFGAGRKRFREWDDVKELDEEALRLKLKLLARPLSWAQPVVTVCPLQVVLERSYQVGSPAAIPRAVLACFSSLVSEFEAIWSEELPNAMHHAKGSVGGQEHMLFMDDDV